MHRYMYMYVYLCICMCVCVHIYVYIYTLYIHVCVYIYIYIYIHIHICIYIHSHMRTAIMFVTTANVVPQTDVGQLLWPSDKIAPMWFSVVGTKYPKRQGTFSSLAVQGDFFKTSRGNMSSSGCSSLDHQLMSQASFIRLGCISCSIKFN